MNSIAIVGRCALVWVGFFAFAEPAIPQQESNKFAVYVTGLDDAIPVVQSLVKKLNNSKPFEAVTEKDPSKVAVLVSCMSRKQRDPFVCMYVSHVNGLVFKTFLGGGVYISTTADRVATNFLGAIAQDIVERFDSISTANLRDALASCLLLTDSKCNVPEPLQKEFGAKQLNLGQYLLKENQ